MRFKNCCAIVAGAMAFALAGAVNAQDMTYEWNGGAGNWHDHTKWTCTPGNESCPSQEYPGQSANTEVRIPSGSVSLSVDLSAALWSVELENSSASLSVTDQGLMSVTNDVEVDGSMSVAGLVNVTGDFDVKSDGDFTVVSGGRVEIGGHLSVAADANALIQSDGELEVTGNLTLVPTAQMEIKGLAEIQGVATIEADASSSTTTFVRLNHATAQLELQDQLFVQATANDFAVLDIEEGVVLLTEAKTHQVGGHILLGSSSTCLAVMANSLLEPYMDDMAPRIGRVFGQNAASEIVILDGMALTSEIVIEGDLQIRYTDGGEEPVAEVAYFVNKHIVSANNNDTLEIGPQMVLEDQAGAIWRADGATLMFNHFGLFQAVGNFELQKSGNDCGVFDLHSNIAHCDGSQTFTDGIIQTGGISVCFYDDCEFFDPVTCGCRVYGDCSCP